MTNLSIRLDFDAILYDVDSTNTPSKPAVVKIIADQAAAAYDLDAGEIYAGLLAREALGSTGFGGATAIPHAKIPDLDECVGVFVRWNKPIGFSAHDGKPVDVVLALLSPENSGAKHLKALAEISRLLRNDQFMGKLRGASTVDALFALLSGQRAQQAA
ncbi:PTS sugar transporter subunit IIA [Parasphingorhabdus halotolerans]|uniref:PTS transporter subunit EIIA n=1 Tax=Parasphingorhabdus halotolerans TaxID=2725558 RepID=A0A6H2DPH7_9SPHN|nr:PTS sugar transporter subunit IIA [Parasphingorhabdus halotolerans]QJB69661.1 PTS transporter subunit EIIA [Parasphingorhabdus halotolerans]